MEFRILGPLEAIVGPVTVLLPSGRPRALLALLLLRRNRVVPVAAIVDALWRGDPPTTAAEIVQTDAAELRRALGDAIETRGRGYILNVDSGALDSERASRLRTEARGRPAAESVELLRDALVLWRGPPLQDVESEDFARTEVIRLNELRLGIHCDLIDAELELGRHREMLRDLEALVRKHPFDERVCAQLLLALHRSGRRTEALQTYEEHRRRLYDELGLEPGETLRALERRIRSDDPALAAPEQAGPRAERPTRERPRSRRPLAAAVVVAFVLAGAAAVLQLARAGGDAAGLSGVASNSVGVIDPVTNTIVEEIPVGSSPTRIAVGEGAVWVLNAGDRTVEQIDPLSRQPIRTITATSVPTDVAAGFGAVWVAGGDPLELVRVDPRSGAVGKRLELSPLSVTTNPASPGAHLVTGFGSVWLSAPMRSRDAFVARINPSSTSVSARFSSLSTGPIAIGSDALWMVKWGALTRIDPGTNSFQERSYQAGLDGRIAVDDRFMWVADELGEAVWQLDAETWRVVRSIPVGDVPSGVAVGFGSVWVASAGGTVTRIDPTSGRVLAVIRTGATVRGIAAGSDAVWVSVG